MEYARVLEARVKELDGSTEKLSQLCDMLTRINPTCIELRALSSYLAGNAPHTVLD
jgi:hypothetical protein